MTETLRPDVLVAGLGPAGAMAAEAAAKAGLDVLAIDRKVAAGQPIQCAEFVPAPIGIEVERLTANRRQLISSMMTYVEEETGDLTDNFPGVMIDRAGFDQQLVNAAKTAGAECRLGCALQTIDPDGTCWLHDGTKVKPRLIVGADGPRSRVGRAAGHVNAELSETRQITAPLLKPHTATDIFLSADIIGGYGWLFPKGDKANIGIGVCPDQRHRLKPLLDELHTLLIRSGRVGHDISYHTGGAIPAGGMLQPVAALGRIPVLLAGDAAGLANPVTGAGINAAVLSGSLAGDAAAEFLAGDADALAEYQEELEDLLKPSLDRAVKRRQTLLGRFERGKPDVADLRKGWIAYPQYWAA